MKTELAEKIETLLNLIVPGETVFVEIFFSESLFGHPIINYRYRNKLTDLDDCVSFSGRLRNDPLREFQTIIMWADAIACQIKSSYILTTEIK